MLQVNAYQFQIHVDDGSCRQFGILQERAILSVLRPLFDEIASRNGVLGQIQWPHFVRVFSIGQRAVNAVRFRVFVEPGQWGAVREEVEKRLKKAIQDNLIHQYKIREEPDWWENKDHGGPVVAQEFTEYLHQISLLILRLLEKRAKQGLRHEDLKLWTWGHFFNIGACGMNPFLEDGTRIATLLFVHGEIDERGKPIENPPTL